MGDNFLCSLIPKLEAEITAAMEASLDASGDGILSYTFNSGQTVSTVQKESLSALMKHIDSLLARRDTLRQRCGLSSASFNAAPGW